MRERVRRPFVSIQDLVDRVPVLRRDELRLLAAAGALNALMGDNGHRRAALWEAVRAARPAGELYREEAHACAPAPLAPMTPEERLAADFAATQLTIGPHPFHFCRPGLERLGVRRAAELKHLADGLPVRVAGCVITRQRPGTAKGFVFLSLEDETGIANIIIRPDLFAERRLVIVSEPFLLVDGVLQNQQGTVSVRAVRLAPLAATAAVSSRDFH